MSNLNKVMIIGRLGSDPSKRTTSKDITVTNFSIATNTYYKSKEDEEKKEKTEWHRIVAFDRLAEICGEYLKKGHLVYVEGSLQTRSYDKEEQAHYITEIVLKNMQMLEPKDN